MTLVGSRRRVLPWISGLTACALATTGFVALTPVAASAATVSLATSFAADLGDGVYAVDVALRAIGAPGGGCPANGGTGAIVMGTITGLVETDTMSAVIGTVGGSCYNGGAAGTGAPAGGAGGAGNADSAQSPPFTTSGAGGGGSTAVTLAETGGSAAIVTAGGGGGAGGLAFISSTVDGGVGGNADQLGAAGTAGTGFSGSGGNGGTVGSDPTGAGVGGAIGSGDGTNGGGGGGGGGSAGGTAAGGGVATITESASGGGGAGGSSQATVRVSNPEYGTSSGIEDPAGAELTYIDITAGSVDDVEVGATYTGTAFTSDSPSSWSNLTWGSSGTLPSGLVVDASTGAVSGNVTDVPGSYNFSVTATADIAAGALQGRQVISKKNITMEVLGLPQTIDFPQPPDVGLSIGTAALTATATSDLTVTYTSLTPSVCTVSGVTVTLLTTGSCSIQADQGGNSTYEAATAVTRTFLVTDASILRPLKPRSLQVINRPGAKKITFKWKAPLNPGNRPVDGYRLLINQRGFPPLLVNRKMSEAKTSFKIRKSYLLGLSRQARGDMGQYVFYRLRVLADNDAGLGPIAKRSFAIRIS